MADELTAKRLNEILGVRGHLMDATVAIVINLLRMTQRPCHIGPGVTSISTGGCIFLSHRSGQAGIIDVASKASVALPRKPSVPMSLGQPNFDTNFRICGGCQRCCNSAECRHPLIEGRDLLACLKSWRNEGPALTASARSILTLGSAVWARLAHADSAEACVKNAENPNQAKRNRGRTRTRIT